MERIDALFDLLDKWRHLPSYQLERRADIFFALYLGEVLESKLGNRMHPELIPEFPAHSATLDLGDSSDGKRVSKLSYKLDYLVFSYDLREAFLVELKTDTGSRRDKQDGYLRAAKKAGVRALLDGLVNIFKATAAKRKYYRLLQSLEKLGLLALPESLRTVKKSVDRLIGRWAGTVSLRTSVRVCF